ncbi:immunoglobulin-like domain-containing protein [Haloarcula sebkhae]|nr:immunoglobulin-like domain-containing protein [Haloarcula sebkhae]
MYDPDRIKWGDTGTVSLRIDQTTFEYGDTAQITLTNTTDSRISTGLKQTYQIERFTDDGWQDVRGKTGGDEIQYVDMGSEPAPGVIYEWSLRLTEAGLVAGDKEFTVCPELVSGRYRFVYWTVDAPVAVAFDLTR